MNDEILEQHLRDLPALELPAAWRAEILAHARLEARPSSTPRPIWPPLLTYFRSLILRNPITAGAMTALWLLILSLRLSTPVASISERMLLAHFDPNHPVYLISMQDQIRLVEFAQEQPEPRQIP